MGELFGGGSGRQAAEAAEKIGAELPAPIAAALRTARGIQAYRIDTDVDLRAATADYISKLLDAADEGKPMPSAEPLAKARITTLASESARDALVAADQAASQRLEVAVKLHADDLVRACQPYHDAAVKRLEKAAEKIPGTILTAEDALMSGHGDQWRDAKEALDAMAAAQMVRHHLRAVVRVEADPAGTYDEAENAEDFNVGTWPQERIARCSALTRAGIRWWLPTASQQQAHVLAVLEQRRAKRRTETVDPRRKVEAEIAAQAGEYFASELAASKAKPAA